MYAIKHENKIAFIGALIIAVPLMIFFALAIFSSKACAAELPHNMTLATSTAPILPAKEIVTSSAITTSTILSLVNNLRIDAGLLPLVEDQRLDTGAQLKANDMTAPGREYWSHVSPYDATSTPWLWFNRAGYAYSYAGENLAMEWPQSSAQQTVEQWHNSATHYANIINAHYAHIGIGIHSGRWQGQDITIISIEFGAPAIVAKK